MVKDVIIRIRDDLDKTSEADKTIEFGYAGTSYELDLTATHADQFDADMARWIEAARVVTPTAAPVTKVAAKTLTPQEEQRKRMRKWAETIGDHLAPRGMVPKDLVNAYAVTHPNDPIIKRKSPKREAPQTVRAQDLKDGKPQWDRTVETREQRAVIRKWGRANGWDVGDKGVIPKELIDQFFNANPEGIG